MSILVADAHPYQYDMTGNLVNDSRNGVTDISYISYNDMPQSITNLSGTKAYRYDNAGQRIVKLNSVNDVEYYIGEVVLDVMGNVKSYQTPEGYAVPLTFGTSVNHFYNLKDWLGTNRAVLNASGITLNATDHYAYGLKMPGRNFSTDVEGNRFQFTGHEFDGETNYEYHGARYYNRELGRYMSVDPMQIERMSLTPYNYVSGNPIMRIDPTGKVDDEFKVVYDENGNRTETKISDLGGDEINYKHIKGGEHDGQTYIGNIEDKVSTYMSTSKFIEGYTHRDGKSTNFLSITGEFAAGVGPEKSLITSGKTISELKESKIFEAAYDEFMKGGGDKNDFRKGKFGLLGAYEAGSNMTEQMIGKANFNFYPVGDKLVVMVTDSKSKSSLSLNPFDGDEVNTARNESFTKVENAKPQTTTLQTYLFTINR